MTTENNQERLELPKQKSIEEIVKELEKADLKLGEASPDSWKPEDRNLI